MFELLENEINKMNDVLPTMKSFILPGGLVAVHLLILSVAFTAEENVFALPCRNRIYY